MMRRLTHIAFAMFALGWALATCTMSADEAASLPPRLVSPGEGR